MATLQNTDQTGGKYKLDLLSGFAFANPAGEHIPIVNRKACGIIAYLALSRTQSVSRERLASLLWSERSEEQARASLRQSIKQLNTIFSKTGFDGFLAERQEVSLAADSFELDLTHVREVLEQGSVPPRLLSPDARPERILYSFEALDQSFAAWLHITRQNWHDIIVNNLQHNLKNGDNNDNAIQAAEALTNIDPTHEEAHRCLIKHKANHGNSAAAIKQYELLWEVLEKDYDLEPDSETQALIVDIKMGTYEKISQIISAQTPGEIPDSTEQSSSPEANQIPVIGIAKFIQGGPWNQEAYIIDGFRKELTASLIRFREWAVVEYDERQMLGSEFGLTITPENLINYKLEGTYLEQDGMIKLIITLNNTLTHRYIWSEQLELSLSNWAGAQQMLVRRISMAMNVYLSSEKLAQHIAQPELPFEAYAKWLQGHHNMQHNWSPNQEQETIDTFQEIIKTSPQFAPAYSSLAAVYNTKHFRNPGMKRSEQSVDIALDFSRKSVEIDPLDTRNHLAHGWSNAMAGRFEQAEQNFEMAFELNPNSPTTLAPCAHGLSYCGNRDKARELAEAAIRMNPSLPPFHWGYISCIRYFDQDFEGCLSASKNAQDVMTDLVGWRAAAQAQLGQIPEAKITAERFLKLIRSRWSSGTDPNDADIISWFLHCFPIRRTQDKKLLAEGLRLAGLPVVD